MATTQGLPTPPQYFANHEGQNIPTDFQFVPPFTTSTATPTASSKSTIEAVTSKTSPPEEKFDPTKHITFTPPDKVLLMEDLGYSEDTGISPVAVSNPFQLFSEDAVEQMRAEILSPEVMKECGFQSNIAASQLRGYSPRLVIVPTMSKDHDPNNSLTDMHHLPTTHGLILQHSPSYLRLRVSISFLR
jgi:hypothetical protein